MTEPNWKELGDPMHDRLPPKGRLDSLPEFKDQKIEMLAQQLHECKKAKWKAADRVRELEDAGLAVVDARYGIIPLPDGVSGSDGDNELDQAIVHLQTLLVERGAAQ